MALTIEDITHDASALGLETVTINDDATEWSNEVDRGEDALVEWIGGALDITGLSSAPTADNPVFTIQIAPVYPSGDTRYDDSPTQVSLTVDDENAKAIPFQIPLLAGFRYFQIGIENQTGVDSDAYAVSLQIFYTKVTT